MIACEPPCSCAGTRDEPEPSTFMDIDQLSSSGAQESDPWQRLRDEGLSEAELRYLDGDR